MRAEETPVKYYERPQVALLPAGLKDISSPLAFKSTNRLMSPKVDIIEESHLEHSGAHYTGKSKSRPL
jgi:hypothetical protein